MQRRLFFAIPAQQLCSALQHSQQQLLPEGYLKPVPADNFHLTLHFLGLQDDSILPLLYQAAAQIQSPAFALQLDRYGLFRNARSLPNQPAPTLQLPVSEFILYESVSGNDSVQYRPLQHWSLLNQLTGKKHQ